jgi:hypothetical protein
MIKQKNRTGVMNFSAKLTFFSQTYPDVCRQTRPMGWSVWIYPDQSRPMIFWSGYIPTRPDLTQNYSGLVYVEHWLPRAACGLTEVGADGERDWTVHNLVMI